MQSTDHGSLLSANLPRFVQAIRDWQELQRDLIRAIRDFQELQRERDALLQLDDDALRDIGLTAAEARGEGQLPFWRHPR